MGSLQTPPACSGREAGLSAHFGDQAQKISTQDQRFVSGTEFERVDLFQFDGRMQPGAVRTEQDLARPGALQRLFQ